MEKCTNSENNLGPKLAKQKSTWNWCFPPGARARRKYCSVRQRQVRCCLREKI